MSDREHDELTEDELEHEDGEPLPDREVMSTIRLDPSLAEPDPPFTLPISPTDDA
jgi:hypothetical protein